MKKLLVTGASGFLGWNVLHQTRGLYHVTGLYHSQPVNVSGVATVQVDLCDEAQVLSIMASVKPDLVIHCAAASKPNFCEEHPELSHTINVKATRLLAQICALQNTKLVFTSTDLVFDGEKGQYAEDSPTGPLMRYGRQKLEAEKAVLETPNGVVCRMPLMFGEAPPTAASFLQGFLSQLQKGESLRLFTDEYRSPLFAEDAAKGLIWAGEHVQGLIHLGGKERMSRYEFGWLMCEAYGISTELIEKGKQTDFKSSAKRSADASLNSKFAFASGFKPKKVADALRIMASKSQPTKAMPS